MKLIEVGHDKLEPRLVAVTIEVERHEWVREPQEPNRLVFVQDGAQWREVETGTALSGLEARELDRLVWLHRRQEQARPRRLKWRT